MATSVILARVGAVREDERRRWLLPRIEAVTWVFVNAEPMMS